MSTPPRRAHRRGDGAVTRHEEELEVGRQLAPLGNVHVEKRVEAERVAQEVPRERERASVERLDAAEGDSGEIETLPDGSVSIPVLEEEIVVTKRVVVRERIVVRKEVTTETEHVEAELRREHVDVDVHEE
jgi:uncharacterized protein (TIGR02271 family)